MHNRNQVHMIRNPYGSQDVIGQYYTDPLPPLNEDGTTSTPPMPLRSLSGMRVVDESEHGTLEPLSRSLAFSKRRPSSSKRLNITPRNHKQEFIDNSKIASKVAREMAGYFGVAAAKAGWAAARATAAGAGRSLYILDDISRNLGGKKKTKKRKPTKRKPTKRKPIKRKTH